jgi:AICAR transformylase/IMP cyclohydrolase PurH
MTPKQFVIVLDEWSAKGGALPESIPHDYAITTAEEANAVCRALSSNHVYAVDQHQDAGAGQSSRIPSIRRHRRQAAFFETKDCRSCEGS